MARHISQLRATRNYTVQLSCLADRLLRESGGTLEAADRREACSKLDQKMFEAWISGQTPSFEQQVWESLSAWIAAKDDADKLWYHAGR